jgi:hypothetical protein
LEKFLKYVFVGNSLDRSTRLLVFMIKVNEKVYQM